MATVGGPERVVDEKSVELRVRWRTGNGQPVEGRLELLRRDAGEKKWDRFRRVRTGENGEATLEVRPRVDTRWRVVAPVLDWVARDRSPVHRVDNLPPGVPVNAADGGAPAAREPPRPGPGRRRRGQREVTAIPDGVWNQMTGRSWHQGCPVGRSGLRLLRINYWAYDGYRHRGELVAARRRGRQHARRADGDVRPQAAHPLDVPGRPVRLVDAAPGRRRLPLDGRRQHLGVQLPRRRRPARVSARRTPTAVALDINPWENPYHASGGWVPNSWWVGRSHPRVAWRSREHAVVALMCAPRPALDLRHPGLPPLRRRRPAAAA